MSTEPEFIAGYRVLRILGRGGMGTVYLAEQDEPVRRQVALKVLRQSLHDGESSARFLAERHAMGRLDHPNVGRILEAGEDSVGRPFFAMEWLDGLPLDRYCHEHQLTIEQRLRLFTAVCRGVAHAHQKQLLHRDLKPSNVLVIEVDGTAVPKVIDFGVAKALDHPLGGVDLKTQHVVGTPVYTSPEGLRLRDQGDPDTRSDVYSLGVMLCELLVGRRPHELEDGPLGTFLLRIAEQDPTSPSGLAAALEADELARIAAERGEGAAALRKALRGDLDWIVLKAVARRREDRYASVADLAADIERHLRSEPIEACPPSWGYLLAKLVRRHRAAAVVAAALVLALLVGIAGLAVGLRRARVAEAQSRADAEEARRARDEAEAVSAFLSGLFLEAAPSSAKVGELTSSADLSAEELVERGAERATASLTGQPDALLRIATLLGEIYRGWGGFEEAESHLAAALALSEAAHLPVGQLAKLHLDLGEVNHELEDFEASKSSYRAARELARRASDPEAADQAAVLRGREVGALVGLARVARTEGEFDLAEAFLDEALAIDRSTPGLDFEPRLDAYAAVASLAISRDQPAKAETPLRLAYELARAELPETHPRRVSVVQYLAVSLAMQDKLDEAGPMFEETLALRAKLLGRRHPDVAQALNNLGVNLMDRGRPADALPVLQEALDIRRETLGETDTMTAWSLDNLGVASQDLGQPEEARALHLQALAIRTAALGDDHPLVARSLSFLARLAEELGEPGSAIPLYRRSIEIRDVKLPPDHVGNAKTRIRLGALLQRLGDPSGGQLIDQGMAILESQLANDDKDLVEMRALLAASTPSR